MKGYHVTCRVSSTCNIRIMCIMLSVTKIAAQRLQGVALPADLLGGAQSQTAKQRHQRQATCPFPEHGLPATTPKRGLTKRQASI